MNRNLSSLSLAAALAAVSPTAQPDDPYDYFAANRAQVRNGVQAVLMCNGLFTSQRSLEQVFAQELAYMVRFGGAVGTAAGGDWLVDSRRQAVAVGREGATVRAAFREGIGCVVLGPEQDFDDIDELPRLPAPPPATEAADIPWPEGDRVDPGPLPRDLDGAALEAASDWAFDRESPEQLTVSLMVLQGDRIVLERYAEGFDMTTRTRTWSTAKSIAVTLIGMLVEQGSLALDEPLGLDWLPPVAEPKRDPRLAITLRHVLNMSSGLYPVDSFDMEYATGSGLAYWAGASSADGARRRGLIRAPGTFWDYENYDTLLAVYAMKQALGSETAYLEFPRHALLDRIGMRNTLVSTDRFGDFVLSSQVYTNARDLARFGLLYLKGGVWNGERLIARSWIDFVRSPAPASAAIGHQYGGQFWLVPDDRTDVPKDAYATRGNRGQFVVIVPSRNAVIVRRGLDHGAQGFDPWDLTREVLKAFPPAAQNEPPGAESATIQNAAGRQSIDLGGAWRVIPDPYETGYYNHRYEPRSDGYFEDRRPTTPSDLVEYDFRRSPELQVPGDWNSQDPRYFLYEGSMWYFRSFDLQPRADRRYLLHFGAANYSARVWLNGHHLGSHEGGFTPFQFEAATALQPGENVIVVKVDNHRAPDQVPTVNTDWWNYGGLTRPVRLIELPMAYLADYRVALAPGGGVKAWARIEGMGSDQKHEEAVTLAIPELGLEAAAAPGPDGVVRFESDLQPRRWSPENPQLYEVRLGYGSEIVEDRIGFRTIETRGEDILLNGEPVFLRGVSIHEEPIGREGRAWSEADARTLLGEALALGCNFVRLAHYPHNENMLRVADELGLMVWAEIPVYWTIDFTSPAVLENAGRQLEEMIGRDANRASVVLWSLANETPISEPRQHFLEALAKRARRLDSTRLLTAALDTQTVDRHLRVIDDPLAATVDVIGINSYCGWYGGSPAECADLRWVSAYGKPIIISEFGAGALAGLHGDPAQRWTEEYQSSVYRYNLQMIDQIEAVRGLSPWILKDFRSPRRPLPGIQDLWNRKGLISESGARKAAWHLMHDYYAARAAR